MDKSTPDKFAPLEQNADIAEKMKNASCLTCCHSYDIIMHENGMVYLNYDMKDLKLWECGGFGPNPLSGKTNERGIPLRAVVAGDKKGQPTTNLLPSCADINQRGDCPRHETREEYGKRRAEEAAAKWAAEKAARAAKKAAKRAARPPSGIMAGVRKIVQAARSVIGS